MALRQEEFTRLCDDVDLDRDRILVERCQAGDAGAFGSLYARYYERLLRFCLRRLHDRHEAEDAAQEAFARAWKALPNFAGERRFYPWLTVIAGNICTDMLRRRSRSTPTEDVELGARPPVGATTAATADEMIIAAADGELAHKALDRLSVRHRHVLALREDSGWTYQQIADHEGVEIGTIETLLWRARQALKREFIALSESKGPFAGFLLAVGAGIRTVVVRSAHRVAALQPGLGSGTFRNALAGFAVTSAAITAAFIAPHTLDSHQAQVPLPAPVATGAGASRATASITPSAGSASGGGSGGQLDGRGSASSAAAARLAAPAPARELRLGLRRRAGSEPRLLGHRSPLRRRSIHSTRDGIDRSGAVAPVSAAPGASRIRRLGTVPVAPGATRIRCLGSVRRALADRRRRNGSRDGRRVHDRGRDRSHGRRAGIGPRRGYDVVTTTRIVIVIVECG